MKLPKVINFHDISDYEQQLAEAILHLDEQILELSTDTINLAVKGPWKEWDEQSETGDIFEFTEEALRDTGDGNVDLLMELYGKMTEIRDTLEAKNKRVAKLLEKRREEKEDFYNEP